MRKRVAVVCFKQFHNLLGMSEDKYHKAEDCRLPGRESKPGPPVCQSFAIVGCCICYDHFGIITLINC
jgi:hypothetical protein